MAEIGLILNYLELYYQFTDKFFSYSFFPSSLLSLIGFKSVRYLQFFFGSVSYAVHSPVAVPPPSGAHCPPTLFDILVQRQMKTAKIL